jgi:mercuric ion binding protein
MKYFGLLLLSWSAFASEVKIPVKGMVCGFCTQGIIKKFSSEPAVEKVAVSLEDEMVTLTVKDGRDIGDKRIEELLEDAGFSAGEVIRTQ